jgi:putative NIF3 family GTP cyclohydrolase 1 type 2
MTINVFVNQLKTSIGITWQETAIDDFLYGNPDMELKNMAVTMMVTQEVLEKAVQKDCNLIITHEPVFYNHHNQVDHLLQDAVYKAKEHYLEKHRLCIFHLHDNLHHGDYDYIFVGMAKKLNWEGYQTDDSFQSFSMPEVKLKDLLKDIQTRLEPTALRYVGDADACYEHVLVSWGFMMMGDGVNLLNRSGTSVLITGETHEWELVEYVQDAIQLGFKKALVVVGHIPSEASGVEFFCTYLQEKFPSLSISYIQTNDPFKKLDHK